MGKTVRRVVLTKVSGTAIARHRELLIQHGTPTANPCQEQQRVIDGLDWLCTRWGATKQAHRRFTFPTRRVKVLDDALAELARAHMAALQHPEEGSAQDANMFFSTYSFIERQLAKKTKKQREPKAKHQRNTGIDGLMASC